MEKAYLEWIEGIKEKILQAQIKASIAVNEALIVLYWDIGKSIVEKQNEFSWGSKIVEEIAKDLKRSLPNTNGFSRTNLFSMRKFYLFYCDSQLVNQAGGQIENGGLEGDHTIVHQVGGQLTTRSLLCKIPWRHHVIVL